jgi:hypothetical protein
MEVACSGLRRSREPRGALGRSNVPGSGATDRGPITVGHAQNSRIIAPRCRARSPKDRWAAQQVLGSPRSPVWPLGLGVTMTDGGNPPTYERSLGLRGRRKGKIRLPSNELHPFKQTGSPAELARQIPISINPPMVTN